MKNEVIKNGEFALEEISGVNKEDRWLKISHEDGYDYYLKEVVGLYDLPLTILFDNFSVTPFVISKAFTSLKELKEVPDIEKILIEIYDQDTVSGDFYEKSVFQIIEETTLPKELKEQLCSNYKAWFME